MRNMRKGIALILALVQVLSFSITLAEGTAPDIPGFHGTLNVRPIGSEEEAIAYAREIWAMDYLGMDFAIAYYDADRFEEDFWIVENASSGVFEVINEAENDETDENGKEEGPYDSDAWAEWRDMLDRKVMYPFLEEANPVLYQEYAALYPMGENSINDFLGRYERTFVDSYDSRNVFDLYYSQSYRDETWCIRIVVQTSPVIRIVEFDIYADAEEGGNG